MQFEFRTFFDCVDEVVSGTDLDDYEVLDVEQTRMGGGYLNDMRSLRSKGISRNHIENYFLDKDDELEKKKKIKKEQEMRLAKLLQEVCFLFVSFQQQRKM